jgi:arginase family enzyme
VTSTAEDHCDVIPFLRACWRKKLFPAKDLLFVHFDAHPDLAVPSTTSVEVSDIKIKKNRGQRNEQKKIEKNRNK